MHRAPRTLRELLIVDDRSTDVYTPSPEALLLNTSVVRNAAPGLGAAYNLAVRTTVSSAIVIVPLVLDPDYVETAARFLGSHPQVSFVSPSVEGERSGQVIQLVDVRAGQAPPWSMFRREAWASVGGFPDDAAPAFTDFCVAVIERGLEGRWLSGPEEARQLSRRPPPEPAVHLRQMTELYRRHASTVSAQARLFSSRRNGFCSKRASVTIPQRPAP